MEKRMITKSRCLFFAFFFLSTLFLLYKCKYGFAHSDEAFYLTIPYRLYLGDGLFLHEWHLSQMSAFILYPLMCFYMRVFGTTDGIFLAFRYFFTAFHTITAVLMYIKIKKADEIAASCISLIYLLYVPFGIMALSYNSMGLGCMALSLVFMNCEPRKTDLFFSGLLYAFSVLCCPYLAILFFLYFLIFVLERIQRKRIDGLALSGICFLYWFAGVLLIAVLFLVFVFSRMNASRLLEVLPAILNDPEHKTKSINDLIRSYVGAFVPGSLMKITDAVAAALFIVALADKRRNIRAGIYFAVVSILIIIQLWFFSRIYVYINFLMLPLNLLIPFLLILPGSEIVKRRNRVLFLEYVFPGVVYTMCIHCSSNQRIYVISSVSFIILLGTIQMLFTMLKNEYRSSPINKTVFPVYAAILLSTEILALGVSRYNSVFQEQGMSNQTELITQGPEKGVYASSEAFSLYNRCYDIITELALPKEKVLCLSENTWLYLIFNGEIAAPSAWNSQMNGEGFLPRLKTYYNINPDKLPELIFSDDVEIIQNLRDFLDKKYYSVVYDDGEVVVYRADLSTT